MLDWQGTYATFFAETKKPGAGFARVAKITLGSGAVIRMTDHDRPVTISGEGTFVPEESFTASAMRQALGGDVSNVSADGITTANVSEQDLARGLFDDAEVQQGLMCWTNPAAGIVWRFRGFLGQIETRDTGYSVEIRALMDFLQRPMGRMYSGECDVREFGDARCGLDLAALGFIHGGGSPPVTVTALGANDRIFEVSEVQADGYFQFGTVEFDSGLNDGWKGEIIGHASDIISLVEKPPYPVEVGNQLILARGCDRTWTTCQATFDNLINFRGFGARKGDVLYFMPPDEILAETPNAN